MREASERRTATGKIPTFSFFYRYGREPHSTNTNLIMEYIEECKDVIEKLPPEFDSHDFIRSLMKNYHVLYGMLIIQSESIASAHSKIANYLKSNQTQLNIVQYPNKVKSLTVFGNEDECANWGKLTNK